MARRPGCTETSSPEGEQEEEREEGEREEGEEEEESSSSEESSTSKVGSGTGRGGPEGLVVLEVVVLELVQVVAVAFLGLE